MASVTVTKAQGSEEKITVDYNFGSTLEEAVELFGAEAVFSAFQASAKIDLQAYIRRLMNATEEESEAPKYTNEEIVAKVGEWKPGTKTRTSSDPMEKIKAMLEKLSPEQRAAFFAAAE